jgi:hypothetical protein
MMITFDVIDKEWLTEPEYEATEVRRYLEEVTAWESAKEDIDDSKYLVACYEDGKFTDIIGCEFRFKEYDQADLFASLLTRVFQSGLAVNQNKILKYMKVLGRFSDAVGAKRYAEIVNGEV